MSLLQTISNTTKSSSDDNNSKENSASVLKRNKSQLFPNVTKIGLKRSNTTKPNALPQIQKPAPSASTSAISFSPSSISKPIFQNSHNIKDTNIMDTNSKSNQIASSHKNSNIANDHYSHPNRDHTSTSTKNTNSSKGILKSPPLIPKDRQNKIMNMQYFHSQISTFYPAFLSSIAYEMKNRIILSDRIKNDIEYSNVFDGKEAVDKIKEILGIADRELALRVGRSLEAQRFFHDVNYENRLIDDIVEIYQFNEVLFHNVNSSHYTHHYDSAMSTNSNNSTFNTSATSSAFNNFAIEDEGYDADNHSVRTDTTISTTTAVSQQQNLFLPIGVYTELTYCYSPTCTSRYPCYSYTCPKRERLRNRAHSVDTRERRVTAYIYEIQKDKQLWIEKVEDYIVLSTPQMERKRQEIIFELIYTEEDFLNDLDYVVKMWIEPLKNSNIIPKSRRDQFIDSVFSNILEIRNISNNFTLALKARQDSHPIVSQIGDILIDFINEFDPFIYYGARQHCAKYIYEHERFNNPKFAMFAEQTERNPASRKLELNGYLTKPTSRLGKYTLLLDKIYNNTSPNHPDKENIPYVIEAIKKLLHKVNNAAGVAKNRFELEQIHRHLKFKNAKDEIDLRLLEPGRSIIKQGILRKTASLDSRESHVILFDHYLVIAKKKTINAVDHYTIQKRPIPIELLGIIIPTNNLTDGGQTILQKSNTLLERSTSPLIQVASINRVTPSLQSLNNSNTRLGSPIKFFHQGRNAEDNNMLFTPDEVNRKAWCEAVRKQKEIKFKRKPAFAIVDSAKRYEFFADIKAHHMVIFNEGKYYLLATDSGLYIGPNNSPNNGVPHKILPLERVHQVHVLEEYQLLLVLADNILWQYPLDITVNGRPDGTQSILHFGRRIRNNVPFFHVGTCLNKTIICVPRPSAINGTDIDIFEPTMPKTEMKKKSLFSKLSIRSNNLSLMNTQVNSLKPIYNPFDVWAIDNTQSLLLLTTSIGIAAVDFQTKKVERLLDPEDSDLNFITRFEKVDNLTPMKKIISVFPVPNGNYLVCYDGYAFYINKRGRRAQHNFKIEWEGRPTAFAYHHPYILAFEQQFIEVRSIVDGHLEQIIQEKNVYCLNNGHKSEKPFILGTMTDKSNSIYQHIFELKQIRYQQEQ